MTYATSTKPFSIFLFFVCLIYANPTQACSGTGIGNASTFFDNSNNETTVEIEFCLGVTDTNGLPSDFTIGFDGINAIPSISSNTSTLSATYRYSEDAVPGLFLCNCNSGNIGNAPTISSNTDTWSAIPEAGKLKYQLSRSASNLIHECQLDCVNGTPLNVTGGLANYLTNVSTCYVINAKFSGDIEGELAGITLSGAENGQCNGRVDMSFGLSASLPVELGSFEGNSKENSVAINWTTLSETNVYKYIVQRSPNGSSQFEELGTVGVFGNSTGLKAYTFEDETPLAAGYYRLKTVDIDGSYSFSDVILVERAIENMRVVNVYPNPVVGLTEIIYETKAITSVHFKVFDVNGTLKADRVLDSVNGFNKIPFDFSELQEGIYFILLESGNENIVKRITKF